MTLRGGEEEVARLVQLLDAKQGVPAAHSTDDVVDESTGAQSTASGDQHTGAQVIDSRGASGSAPPTTAADPDEPPPGFAVMHTVLHAARASKHLPALVAAEMGDDMLELVWDGVVEEERFVDALGQAGVPLGPRTAIAACVARWAKQPA